MDEWYTKELLQELQSIKKLLILQLMKVETAQKEIATMLGISEATMSRMIPRGTTIKGARKKGKQPNDEGA